MPSAERNFLEVDGRDPSQELHAQYTDRRLPVLPGSSCDPSMDGVFDEKTRKKGILLTACRFASMEDGLAAARVFDYCGGLCAAGHVGLFAETPAGWRKIRAMKYWFS